MKRLLMLLLAAALLLASAPVAAVRADGLDTEEKYDFLVKQGIFTGFDDGSARLGSPMTREQFAAVLFRLWELREENTRPFYNDVLKTRWSFGEIQAVTQAGLLKGMGSGKFAPAADVTIEQLAVVLVRAHGASGSSSAPVYGSVSAWAKKDVGIALGKGWLPEQASYKANAIRALLVQASYSIFVDMYPEKDPERKKLDVAAVQAISNHVVQVDLRSAVSSVSADQFALTTDGGRAVGIQRVSLSADGRRVLLTTDWQYDGDTYRLKVEGTAWVYRVSLRDTTKPYIVSSAITSDARIELVFSEALNRSTAENESNYSFNKNLAVKSATLAADNRKVTLTTGAQAAATVYTLTVKNVKDLAGNTMATRNDLHFGSVVDRTAPVVSRITLAENKIVLAFSEALDAGSAERKENYALDGGLGHPWRADYNEGDRTVTLSTTDQTSGKVYTLSLSGIKDKAGNAVAAGAKLTFAGVGKNAIPQLAFIRAEAVNENMVDVYFNRSLADLPLSQLKLEIVSDNGASVSMSGWQTSHSPKQGDDRALRFQLRTSADANPDLFREGHVYVARITGIPGLKTADNANLAYFAGIGEPNRQPEIAKAEAVDKTSVTVYFSEPVKNVAAASFRLADEEGAPLKIAGDQLNDRNKVVTRVTLNLEFALEAGKTYRLSGGDGVTDAPGWNGLLTVKDGKPHAVSFKGSSEDNAAPRIQSVTASDKHTLEIEFTESVAGADQDVYALYDETDRKEIGLTGGKAGFAAAEDGRKVIVRLYEGAAGPLDAGHSYKLTYLDASRRIADLQGKLLDAADGRGEARFRGSDRDNARPQITAVEARSGVVLVTLSEPVTGNPQQAFELTASGSKLAATASLHGRTVLLLAPALQAEAAAYVRLTPQGEDALLDPNRRKAVQQTVHFKAQE
ncbi:Ig-like domain-containing protein [Paenibacillus arenilitoris]|nr:Ig-like domain-containing protein [Paenibacillus arenilitoris]